MIEVLTRRLIDLREASGLSQTEVARRVGIDNSSLSRIESGDRKVSAEELSKFADVYGVTTDYLVGKNGTPKWATPEDVIDLKEVLEGNEQPRFNFGGDKLTDTQNEKLKLAITQVFWDELRKSKGAGDHE